MSLNVKDDRGFNQGFKLVASTEIRMKRRAEFIISKMDPGKKGDVLEIGCGRGELSYWIAESTGNNVIGSDLCIPFINDASQHYQLPNLSYEVLDFNHPDHIKNRKFDYIVGNGILHHLYAHMDDALTTLFNLLKPGGKIIFMEPNIYNPYCAIIFKIGFMRKVAHLEPDEMAFSGAYIRKKLQFAGFSNIETKYRDFLLPGVPEWSVKPIVAVGSIVEKIPLLDHLAQSVFISAEKNK
jgi:2-polyprenyl-3-methyl-5-hydroxy-6-metoxy-1,4-benzoquinol methylase